MTPAIPRPEHPRPDLTRTHWMNLNGAWAFEQDPDNVGLKQRWHESHAFSAQIIVPYPVESEASGIGDRHPAAVVWYQREFTLPSDWPDQGVALHIGACDFNTRVFVNGLQVTQHQGGYSPISCDISDALRPGSNAITVRAADSLSWSQPRGKQEGTTRWPIDYDGVTGIWQTVWLESRGADAIIDIHADFSPKTKQLKLTTGLGRLFSGSLEAVLRYEGDEIGRAQTDIDQRGEAKLGVNLSASPLWSPAEPRLCELELVLRSPGGVELDRVQSYTGLREWQVNNGEIILNGEPLFLRGVLDQGYFPGGWYTPLDDDAIRRDVELTLAMGFNCARKHQKAEDPRYLYWADRLGLLVWAEMPSGRVFSADLVESLTREWLQLIRRDRSHPCIMAWVPFNESWGVWNQAERPQQRAFVDAIVDLTRTLDDSRLIIGNDGWEYSSGDLWTLHLYEGDGTPFAERLQRVLDNPRAELFSDGRVGALPGADVTGLPVLLTECGGVGFIPAGYSGDTFAYGDIPDNTLELERRFRAIAADISAAAPLRGFVWTQLTDIQQEINGVLTFEREPKLPIETLKEIFSTIRP